MSRSFRRLLARNRRNPLVKKFARQIQSWQRGYEKFDYDPQHNGEGFLIKTVADSTTSEATLFDVGANVGEWSQLSLDISPAVNIHAFKLVPSTAEQLATNLGQHPDVVVNAFGLSDTPGEFPVKINVDDSTRSTLITNAELGAVNSDEIICTVCTGDNYLSQNKIDHIDLLKIDAEGADHLVLKGFSEALAQEKIGSIQFEYGRAAIAANFLLKDFYEYLTSYGFSVGKLYPNHVEFRLYSTDMEDFLGPNFVAVHRTESEARPPVLASLQSRPID